MMSLMITLNINGLNAITKNTEKLIGLKKKKNQTHLYAAYKRLTSELKIQTP